MHAGPCEVTDSISLPERQKSDQVLLIRMQDTRRKCKYGGVPRETGCSCEFSCKSRMDLNICGSDRKIYHSLCGLRKASCENQKWMTRISNRHCVSEPSSAVAVSRTFTTTSSTAPSTTTSMTTPTAPSTTISTTSSTRITTMPATVETTTTITTSTSTQIFSTWTELDWCAHHECFSLGTAICSITGCNCHHNVKGKKCDRCASGFYNIKTKNGCIPCECSPHSSRPDCDQDTGKCRCSTGYEGDKCEIPSQYEHSSGEYQDNYLTDDEEVVEIEKIVDFSPQEPDDLCPRSLLQFENFDDQMREIESCKGVKIFDGSATLKLGDGRWGGNSDLKILKKFMKLHVSYFKI